MSLCRTYQSLTYFTRPYLIVGILDENFIVYSLLSTVLNRELDLFLNSGAHVGKPVIG